MRGLDPHGAIFVLGDLPDRIELRIGEHVRRRLHIGERDEDRTLLDVSVGTGSKLDASPSRGHPHRLAGLHPVTAQRCGVETRGRAGLQQIEHLGAPRHGPGVPMLELPPGHQHQGIFAIGDLSRGQDIGRHELGAA